jgi:hypothetical protein
MTYEINELIEVGEAGSTIQAEKPRITDELSGVTGPNDAALETE